MMSDFYYYRFFPLSKASEQIKFKSLCARASGAACGGMTHPAAWFSQSGAGWNLWPKGECYET
jgi:hypothetical protein